ncbi:asparaginase [Rhizocola hellebori]|uniref:Asparaginase n=1 Tax=Rhizocola hellebori TaxID=1392758 RepID=A0A8J3QKD1_9ACTN|nr:asparaginase [Rhizocola hellebori]GIH11315.1 asparaginase [Rhizocola hellebori]
MKTYSGGAPLATIDRSGFIEGRHHGSVIVLSASGEVVDSIGDPTGPVFPRSTNKPFQAIGMMRSGLRLDDPADIAVIAASHSGEDFHLSRIRALLGDLEVDLRCPPDWRLAMQCGEKKRIYMNCSGKHTGMLLSCVANGWSRGDYYEPEHPLQVAIKSTLEELTGESVAAIGVDGCGAPVMAVSLNALATGFLRVAGHEVADAMRAHPELVSGTGRADALLMRAVPGLVCKGGAEGVWAAAIPGVGAVAMKIDDGAARALGPVMVSALRRLDIKVDDPTLSAPALLGRGDPVGAVRSLW